MVEALCRSRQDLCEPRKMQSHEQPTSVSGAQGGRWPSLQLGGSGDWVEMDIRT